jgi:tRNA A37 methylthiotransferase MiaB
MNNGCYCHGCNGCREVPRKMSKERLKIIRAQDKRIEMDLEKTITQETIRVLMINIGEPIEYSDLYLECKGVFK